MDIYLKKTKKQKGDEINFGSKIIGISWKISRITPMFKASYRATAELEFWLLF